MNIGFIGLGKLGLPCALAIEKRGHEIVGFDLDQKVLGYIENKKVPYKEFFVNTLLQESRLSLVTVNAIVETSDLIFVAVQTPHEAQYEGITPLPDERKDFNYQYLKTAIGRLNDAAKELKKNPIVVVISTVLPGTMYREINPLAQELRLCYNPFFIAMGTTIPDFLNPEFILLGVEDKQVAEIVTKFYNSIIDAPVYKTSVINAELIKVSYNTFITMKITFVNTLLDICEKVGGNVDEVTNALKLANRRLISTSYMTGGMGDGGGCHPRDNIALSWFAKDLGLEYDLFESMMKMREAQTRRMAFRISEISTSLHLPIIILGKSFKPETNITTGSPSILLYNILTNELKLEVKMYDPLIDMEPFLAPVGIYFIGTKHEEFNMLLYPEGSTIIDPWGYIKPQKGVRIIKPGRH